MSEDTKIKSNTTFFSLIFGQKLKLGPSPSSPFSSLQGSLRTSMMTAEVFLHAKSPQKLAVRTKILSKLSAWLCECTGPVQSVARGADVASCKGPADFASPWLQVIIAPSFAKFWDFKIKSVLISQEHALASWGFFFEWRSANYPLKNFARKRQWVGTCPAVLCVL